MTPRRQTPRAPVSSPAAATVFTTVLTEGPVSRVEVARRTGLSSAAVTKAARPLIEAGYLTELDSEQGSVGRPASPLDVVADREFFVGVKITHNELVAVVTDLHARIRIDRREPLTSRKVDSVVSDIEVLVAEMLAESPAYIDEADGFDATGEVRAAEGLGSTGGSRVAEGLGALGDLRAPSGLGATGDLGATSGPRATEGLGAPGDIGSPGGLNVPGDPRAAGVPRATGDRRAGGGLRAAGGANVRAPYRERTFALGVTVAGDVDRVTGLVRYSPFLHWRDVQLAEPIAEVTGLDVVVDNDVKSLTAAEQWFGHGIGAPSFALVTLGTGIGCGLVINGDVVNGSHGVAGEIGHIPVSGDGPLCHCGATGCVEAIASSAAIVAQARTATGEPSLTLDEVITGARMGDPALRRVFARAGVAIGRGLAAMANLVGPERIIVSGEGLDAYDLFADEIRETFATQAFGAASECELILRPLPLEEWARGAAAIAVRTLFRS